MVKATLGNTIGALQLGSLSAVFLFGIISRQTYSYYQTFRRDKWQYKTLVAVLWLLELLHTVLIAYEVYNATITNFGHIDRNIKLDFLGTSVSVGGAITLIVHSFFSLRLLKVLPRPYHLIGAVCIALSTARFGASIYLTHQAILATNVVQYRHDNAVMPPVLLGGGAAIDIVIAMSMLYYLFYKRDQSLNRILRLIDRLVQYTVRTGVLTSVGAVAVMVAYLVLPNTLIWGALYASLAKLYTNCLLSSLNERIVLREEIAHTIANSDPPVSPRNIDFRRTMGPPPVSVEMKKSVHQEIEHCPTIYMAHPMSPSCDQPFLHTPMASPLSRSSFSHHSGSGGGIQPPYQAYAL